MSIRDKHVHYVKGHRNSRPLAHIHADSNEPVGKFATIEHSNNGRFRIEMKKGAPVASINRIASLVWLQSRTHADARLNMLIDGKEVFMGRIKQLGKKKIREIIARAAREGGVLVVVSEETGGSLGSKFWRHSGMASVLSS